MTVASTPVDDLSPRPPRPARTRRRKIIPVIVAVGAAAAVVVLAVNLLNGSLYFYDAKEAVARRPELGTDRFTLLGSPIGGTIVSGFQGDEPVVAFTVAFDGVDVDVVHFGDPPDLFQAGVPVVLDGAWVNAPAAVDGFAGRETDGWHFASDRMRIKHDNNYKSGDSYSDRIHKADQQGRIVATSGASGR